MNSISIRHYEPADYEMLCAWWKSHHEMIRPEIMLPKCGVVCELNGQPVSALFLHMDNSCGMCMAEHAVSAPGLPLKKALLAFKHCVTCLKKIARDLGYHTMAVFTYPSISRVLKSQGFSQTDTNLIQMLTSTKEEPNG
jgi:hypothetical protein